MLGWQMNGKGFGRKQSCTIPGTIPTFTWLSLLITSPLKYDKSVFFGKLMKMHVTPVLRCGKTKIR
jgi:hypothetical protein